MVLGMGGFVSGPGGIAAWILRIPLCIHEQNAIAGLTNRILAPFSKTVMAAFPDAFKKSVYVQLTGNPVREEILNVHSLKSQSNTSEDDILRLLVIGGSLGARSLNEVIPQALNKLPADVKFEVKHQTGEKLLNETRDRYKTLGQNAQLIPFIDDIASAYAWAVIVICRAGAMTISELAAVGVASILIPYPHAVDDHQTANARYLSDNGAAYLFNESEFTAEKLAALLRDLFHSRSLLKEMSISARNQARPRATQHVSELCLEAAYV